MTALVSILVAIHTLGAALGAAGATYAEVIYTKAMADGKLDTRERDYFTTTFWALKWGMLTVLVSGLLLIVVQYFLPWSPDELLYRPLWMQNTLALFIAFAAQGLARYRLSWWLGSSLIFAGWWMVLALDSLRDFSFSYIWLLLAYVFATLISATFWGYARVLAHERGKMKT